MFDNKEIIDRVTPSRLASASDDNIHLPAELVGDSAN